MWVKLEKFLLIERSESLETTCCMNPFIWNVQSREIHRVGKQINGCQALGWGEGKMGSEGYRVLGPPGCYGRMGPCSLVACNLGATETLPWVVALLLGPRMLLSAEAVSPCALKGSGWPVCPARVTGAHSTGLSTGQGLVAVCGPLVAWPQQLQGSTSGTLTPWTEGREGGEVWAAPRGCHTVRERRKTGEKR